MERGPLWAETFAKRVLAGVSTFDAEQVRKAYRLAYGREALTEEVEASLTFVESQAGSFGGTPDLSKKLPNETGLRPAAATSRR